MKRRILYVNLYPEIGGAETSLIYLIQALNKNLFEPCVLLPEKGSFSERLKGLGIKVIFLKLPGYSIQTMFIPGASPIAIIKFFKLCLKLKPNIIHLTHMTLSVYAGITGKILNIPVISTCWVSSESIYFYQDLISRIFLDKIIAVTPELKKRLTAKSIINEKSIQVLTPGLPVNKFKPSKRAVDGVITITIVGRFDPEKDYSTFIRAASIIVKKIKNIKFLIVGSTKKNLVTLGSSASKIKLEIDRYIDKDKVLGRAIYFIGYKKYLVPIYRKTDIFVSSSRYESLGMAIMEAASCGVPVVATKYGGQRHIVKDGVTGFLVSPKNPKTLAEKILILIKDRNLRQKYSEEGRKHILKYFDVNKYAKKMEKVYLEISDFRR